MPASCHKHATVWKMEISTALRLSGENKRWQWRRHHYELQSTGRKDRKWLKVKSEDNTYCFSFSPEAYFFLSLSGFLMVQYSGHPQKDSKILPQYFFLFLQLATYPTRKSIFNTNLNALYCHLGLNVFSLSSGLSKNSRQLVTVFATINLLGASMAKGVGLHRNLLESLLKQISGPYLQNFWYIDPVWNSKICISNMFPSGTHPTDPWITLYKPLFFTDLKPTISKVMAVLPKFSASRNHLENFENPMHLTPSKSEYMLAYFSKPGSISFQSSLGDYNIQLGLRTTEPWDETWRQRGKALDQTLEGEGRTALTVTLGQSFYWYFPRLSVVTCQTRWLVLFSSQESVATNHNK